MGHIGRNWDDVASRVAVSLPLMLASHVPTDLATWIGGRHYADLFREAFGTSDVTGARIAMAIASYERTLYSTQTPFDSLIAGTAALTPQEAQGFQLFGQLGCAGCHAGSLMSDNQYHYIGVRPDAEDIGREAVTLNAANRGEFRTPSLRNVALRPAYMHNGRFTTLEDVVEFYNRGGDFNAPNKPPVIRPLNLTPGQKAALLAFLRRPLIDPRVANGTAPFDRPTLYTESALVPEALGGGVPGTHAVPPVAVAIEPAVAGNDRFTVGVYGASVGDAATLVVDAVEPPVNGIPTSASFARIETQLASDGSGGGYGSATLSIPADPSQYGRVLYGRWYVSDPGAAGGVAASPAFRFTVFGPNGTTAPEVTGMPVATSSPLQLSAGPNPFNARTTLRFDLAQRSRARLVVYDVTGRAVRKLYDRVAVPGAYAVDWDGRDDAGHAMPGGVYFYRLETDRDARAARVTRLD